MLFSVHTRLGIAPNIGSQVVKELPPSSSSPGVATCFEGTNRTLSVTLSEPACLQPVSLCQRSSSKRDGLSNTSSKQVQRSPHQLKACQVVRHESLCRPLSNPLTEKCTPSVVLLMRNRMWEQFRTPLKSDSS